MIRISDNSKKNISDNELKYLSDLQKISELKINSKDKVNSNLLVFSNRKEKITDKYIFELDGSELITNNIMGFVGINDCEVTIRSRFATGDNDLFLHYMLQKVFSINIYDLKHRTTNENVFDFLLYLFPYYLKKALRQGLYKEYKRKEYNNSNIKGSVNISKHINSNMPFVGKIAYTTREHSYDNKITQLIRHTIEQITMHKFANNILSSDSQIQNNVYEIIQATPTFTKNAKLSIMNDNVRPLIHPYFSEYTDLQRICLQILRYDGLRYSQEKDKIYGLLFDGAWLWEEYINTILKDSGFKHPRNNISEGGIHIFKDANYYLRYPDFWKEKFVVDAKYKFLNNKNAGRDDMHQIISYIHILNAKLGCFLYPHENKGIAKKEIGTLNGYGGKVIKIGFPISQENIDFKNFCSEMGKDELRLKELMLEYNNKVSDIEL